MEDNNIIKGNKGEWSEFYTFLKLLADGKIYAADNNLNKNEDLFYLILKIIRGKEEDFEYVRNKNILIQRVDGELISQIEISEIKEYAEAFYEGIKKGKVGERSFQLDFAQLAFNRLKTYTLSDERKETADIRIVIHDPITHHEPLLGFQYKIIFR